MLDNLLKAREEIQNKINQFVTVNEQLTCMVSTVRNIPNCSLSNHKLPRGCGKSSALSALAIRLLTDVSDEDHVLVVINTQSIHSGKEFASLMARRHYLEDVGAKLYKAADSGCMAIPFDIRAGTVKSEVLFVNTQSDLRLLLGSGAGAPKYTKVVLISDESKFIQEEVLNYIIVNCASNVDLRSISFCSTVAHG